MILEDPELLHLGYINACHEVSDVSPTVAYYHSSLTVTMTQSASPSSQTDTLVSVRLDGLINILLGLGLEDRMAISAALQEAGTGQNVTEGESVFFFDLSCIMTNITSIMLQNLLLMTRLLLPRPPRTFLLLFPMMLPPLPQLLFPMMMPPLPQLQLLLLHLPLPSWTPIMRMLLLQPLFLSLL